jgi:hypothetical protein
VDKTTSRKLRIPYPEINYGTTSKRKQTNQIKELLIIDNKFYSTNDVHQPPFSESDINFR